MKKENRKKGNIFIAVAFALVLLGVYVHHLFFLFPLALLLLVFGFAKLIDWTEMKIAKRKEDEK